MEGIIIRRPTPIPEKRIKELEEFRKKKWPSFEFQRFLCVWLRVAQNMSTSDIAIDNAVEGLRIIEDAKDKVKSITHRNWIYAPY